MRNYPENGRTKIQGKEDHHTFYILQEHKCYTIRKIWQQVNYQEIELDTYQLDISIARV